MLVYCATHDPDDEPPVRTALWVSGESHGVKVGAFGVARPAVASPAFLRERRLRTPLLSAQDAPCLSRLVALTTEGALGCQATPASAHDLGSD